MNCENIKYMSKNTKLAQVASLKKLRKEISEKEEMLLQIIEIMIKEVPLTDIDKEADQLYEIIKDKQKISSLQIKGLHDRNHEKRLFDTLVRRHPEVETREVQRKGDRKKIIEAYIGKEPEKQDFAETIQSSEDIKLKKIFGNYVSKSQIAQAMNISLEEAQKLISRLVCEKRIIQSPESNGAFKWVGD